MVLIVVIALFIFNPFQKSYAELSTDCDSRIISGELVYREHWEYLHGDNADIDPNSARAGLAVCSEVGIY